MDLARLTPNLLSLRAARSMQPLVSANIITCGFWSDCNPALYSSSLNSAVLSALLSYSRRELKIKGRSRVSFQSVHMNTFNTSLLFCGKINHWFSLQGPAPQAPPHRAPAQPASEPGPSVHTHTHKTQRHTCTLPHLKCGEQSKGKKSRDKSLWNVELILF